MALGPITVSVSAVQGTSNPYASVKVDWSYSISNPGPFASATVTLRNFNTGSIIQTIYNSSSSAPSSNSGSTTVTGLTPGTLYTARIYVETYTTSADLVSKSQESTIGTRSGVPVWSGDYVNGTVGTSYSDTATAYIGGFATTYTKVSGTIPPGLSLSTSSNNALISGTPTAAGTYSFVLRATNAYGTADKSFSLKVIGPDGEINVYDGSSWVQKPVTVYNGTSWPANTPVYYYNGSTWVLSKGQ